jgi:alpha-galactosidase
MQTRRENGMRWLFRPWLWSASAVLFGLVAAVQGKAELASNSATQARAWVASQFQLRPDSAVPFSFNYGGVPLRECLPGWDFDRKTSTDGTVTKDVFRYTNPADGLTVEVEATTFDGYDAVEWVLHLENTGTSDSAIIENLLPLDTDNFLGVRPYHNWNTLLRSSNGDRYNTHGAPPEWADRNFGEGDGDMRSFLATDETLHPSRPRVFESKASAHHLPYFNLISHDGNFVLAVGWSGYWKTAFDGDDKGMLRIRMGQLCRTHFKLLPGERVRTPSVLLVRWAGSRMTDGHNVFRRLMLHHYVPHKDGEPAVAPYAYCAAVQTVRDAIRENRVWDGWYDYYTAQTEWTYAPKAIDLGVEVIWIDAFIYPRPWDSNFGNWYPDPQAFPDGVEPISRMVHDNGKELVMWFVPHAVHGGTQLARECPQYIDGGVNGGMWKMDEPEARTWLVDYISGKIQAWNVDIYREDGISVPVDNDTTPEDRVGVRELHFVEASYRFWDELRERNPGLLIDNCSGGGNRIDIETVRRSFALWRTDSTDWPYRTDGREKWVLLDTNQQNLIAGLSLYVPFHSGASWEPEKPYNFRSNMTTGAVIACDMNEPGFNPEIVQCAIAEGMSLRPYFMGDRYPLIEATPDHTTWYAYQLDRPDLGEGCVFIFRRPLSLYETAVISLEAIDAEATYSISHTGETYDRGEWKEVQGKELINMPITIQERATSVLLRYKRAGNACRMTGVGLSTTR